MAVVVEVAHDGISRKRTGEVRVPGIDIAVVVGVEIPGRAVEQPHLIAVGGVFIEVRRDRQGVKRLAVGFKRLGNCGHVALVVGKQPAIVAVGALAVSRQFGKAVGRACFTDIGGPEVAGENLVAGVTQGIDEVAVGGVRVGRVEGEVPVGVDILAPAAPRADLRPAIDGEAGDEVPARLTVAAGEGRRRWVAGHCFRRRACCPPDRPRRSR